MDIHWYHTEVSLTNRQVVTILLIKLHEPKEVNWMGNISFFDCYIIMTEIEIVKRGKERKLNPHPKVQPFSPTGVPGTLNCQEPFLSSCWNHPDQTPLVKANVGRWGSSTCLATEDQIESLIFMWCKDYTDGFFLLARYNKLVIVHCTYLGFQVIIFKKNVFFV